MRAKHLMHHAFSISGSGYWLQWCALRPQKKKNCSVLISVLMSRFILGPTKWLKPNITLYLITTLTADKIGCHLELGPGWKCIKQSSPFFAHNFYAKVDGLIGVCLSWHCHSIWGITRAAATWRFCLLLLLLRNSFFLQNAKTSLINLKIWKGLTF